MFEIQQSEMFTKIQWKSRMTIKILSGVYNNFFEFAINVEDAY